MEKIHFQDEVFAVVEKEPQALGEPASTIGAIGRFTRYMPSSGQFALVLPFKKQKNRYLYLTKRQLIPGWDSHPNLCALSGPSLLEPPMSAILVLKDHLGIEINLKSLVSLGVCAASKWSDDTYYLYSADLTGMALDNLPEGLQWSEEESLIESLDPQLIVAVTRLRLVP